jgi:hypothetical protein
MGKDRIMPEIIKLKNKKTGEIVTLRKKAVDKPSKPDIDIALPAKEATEELISKRRHPIDILKEEVTYAPKTYREAAFKAPVTALKTLAVPVRLGEAGISNMLMKLQEGDIGRFTPPHLLSREEQIAQGKERTRAGLESVKEAFVAGKKGIIGERLGEFGDVPRRAGFSGPRPGKGISDLPSSFIGFGTLLGIGELFAPGKIAKRGALPEEMTKDYTFDKATRAAGLIDDVADDLGKHVGQSIDDVGDALLKTDDIQAISKASKKLPSNVLTAIDDPLYEISKLPDGSIEPTMKNMQRMEQMLNDHMTKKAWYESGDMAQRVVKKTYGIIREGMKKKAKEMGKPIDNALDRYHRFMGLKKRVNKTIRDTGGEVLEKRTRGAFKPGAERNYRRAWEEMIEFIPEFKQIAKDMTKFTAREGLKRVLGRAAEYGGRALILGGVIGRTTRGRDIE